jgi:hypothetical protein
LQENVGEHIRAMPEINHSGQIAMSMASTAVPCAPMYSEGVGTLVYFQDVDTMWALFTPFEWQLWVSIGCMVSAPHAAVGASAGPQNERILGELPRAQVLLMAVFKFLVFMTTPEAKEELGGARAQAGEAMFRSWVSLLDAGALGETADGPGSRIMTLGWLFFVLVRRDTRAHESCIRPTPPCAWACR